jgi:hypothetical protein
MPPTRGKRDGFSATIRDMNRKTSTDSKTTGACPTTDSSDRGAAHRAILETYFFEWIDRGIGADETPLFTLRHGDEPLLDAVARQFRLSREDAQHVIEAARQEVAL